MSVVVSALVIGAVATAATATHTIESSNQQKRIAGQQKNQVVAAAATAAQEDSNQRATIERDLMRVNQRRRSFSGAGQALAMPNAMLSGQPQQPIGSGTGTLIGQ